MLDEELMFEVFALEILLSLLLNLSLLIVVCTGDIKDLVFCIPQ